MARTKNGSDPEPSVHTQTKADAHSITDVRIAASTHREKEDPWTADLRFHTQTGNLTLQCPGAASCSGHGRPIGPCVHSDGIAPDSHRIPLLASPGYHIQRGGINVVRMFERSLFHCGQLYRVRRLECVSPSRSHSSHTKRYQPALNSSESVSAYVWRISRTKVSQWRASFSVLPNT